MSVLTRRAAILVVCATTFLGDGLASPVASADAGGGTRVPLGGNLRACDFSRLYNNRGTIAAYATVSSVIRVTGGTVAADLHLVDTYSPNTHYDVRLIQEPRTSAASCNAGDPGVTAGGLDSDGGGQANTTVQGGRVSGATGVWVYVTRPSPSSQDPTEFYTSDFVAPV